MYFTLKVKFNYDFNHEDRVRNQEIILYFLKNIEKYPQSIINFWIEEFDYDGLLNDTDIFNETVEQKSVVDLYKNTNNIFINIVGILILQKITNLDLMV